VLRTDHGLCRRGRTVLGHSRRRRRARVARRTVVDGDVAPRGTRRSVRPATALARRCRMACAGWISQSGQVHARL